MPRSTRNSTRILSGGTRRSAVACKSCHARKVRCTVDLSGPPCANCAVDEIPCELNRRKRRQNPHLLSTVHTPGTPSAPRISTVHQGDNISVPPSIGSEAAIDNGSDLADDRSVYSKALEPRRHSDDGGAPFYLGDKRGPGFVIDICGSRTSTETSHFLVPIPRIPSLKSEDLRYLQAKGAFSLPVYDKREALIRSYFSYVHPFAPILDPDEFFTAYKMGKASLLLLWSIFLAAASFIDDDHFNESFYPSRMELKKAMYQRAKALYDVDYEKSKITLIQSVFLLSHWFTHAEDRTGPWHWNGVAIGLCHTAGLHRLSDSSRQDGPTAKPTWRRLWWSVYCREVWLSQAQGRPVRIQPDDADTSIPTAQDISGHVTTTTAGEYLPREIETLLRGWLDFVNLSGLLGKVLLMSYRMNNSEPTSSELTKVEADVRACCHSELIRSLNEDSHLSRSHVYQLKLYFQAVIITLYRPWLLNEPAGAIREGRADLKAFASSKVRTAASDAMSVINAIMAEDMVAKCQSITVLGLLPIMQIHLFEWAASHEKIRSSMAKHNLALCMVIMDGLRDVYLAADAAYKLFDTAMQKVSSGANRSSCATGLTGSMSDATNGWAMESEPSASGLLFDLWPAMSSDIDGNLNGFNIFGDGWMDISSMGNDWELEEERL